MVPELGYYAASSLMRAKISESQASHWTAATPPAVPGLSFSGLQGQTQHKQACQQQGCSESHKAISASTSRKPQLQVALPSCYFNTHSRFSSLFYSILSSFIKLCSPEPGHYCDPDNNTALECWTKSAALEQLISLHCDYIQSHVIFAVIQPCWCFALQWVSLLYCLSVF